MLSHQSLSNAPELSEIHEAFLTVYFRYTSLLHFLPLNSDSNDIVAVADLLRLITSEFSNVLNNLESVIEQNE